MAPKRVSLAFFLVIGIICLYFAYSLNKEDTKQAEFWAAWLLHICTVFFGVVLIGIFWDYLGGEPQEKTIIESKQIIEELNSKLNTTNKLVEELKEKLTISNKLDQMGVLKFWLSRTEGESERREKYLQLIPNTKKIDLMGLTLTTEILDDAKIKAALLNAVRSNDAKIRILVSKPDIDNKITEYRANEPGERNQEVFTGLLKSAFDGLENIYNELKKIGKDGNIEINVAHNHVIYSMIIRIDKQMFVCNYFSALVGNQTPAVHIFEKEEECLFNKYEKEFESAFGNGEKYIFPHNTTKI